MATAPDTVFYRQLVREIRRGRVTPFLGAGVNLCGRPPQTAFKLGQWLPSGRELAHHLAQEFAYPFEPDTDLVKVSQWVTVRLDNEALYAELHNIFDRDYRPTVMHRVLAKLPAFIEREKRREYPLFVTTNYDDALEEALTEARIEFDLLTYIAAGRDRGKFRHHAPDGETTVITLPNKYDAVSLVQRTVVAKIHGAVQRRELDQDLDSYVVSEDDYIDALTRTDIVELLPSSVVDRMRHCHYLFLGYSLQDWNLRAILHRIRRDQTLGNASWVVQPNPDELEEKAWRNRKVETLDISLEEFTEALDELLSTAHTDGSSDGQLASS
jgi:SIR2-like domain